MDPGPQKRDLYTGEPWQKMLHFSVLGVPKSVPFPKR